MGSGGIQLMATYIQLRDGVGYAVIHTHGEPDHSVTPDHTTAILIEDENPDQFLKMKYDGKTNTWSNAPIIRFAEVNENGIPIEIRRTVFEHEVPSNCFIMPDEADGSWKVIDGEWVPPVIYVNSTPPDQLIILNHETAMIESSHDEEGQN